MKKRGLTLGKYAPLHRGHQLVIETALAEMDEVAVIIYDSPAATAIPLSVRAEWIRSLYPQVELIEAWDGPAEVGYTPAIMRRHEDYVINKLQLKGVTHFYSSEPYAGHMSAALGAVNRMVDPERRRVPVSATAIRADAYKHRAYLEPLVYRDLVANIAFLGAPSTGKTTLAERLARAYHTRWMPEYGREYWEKHQVDRRLTPAQLVEIAEGHLAGEESLLREADRYLFTDTNALTTYTFCRYYHGQVPPRLAELARRSVSRYDLVFLCDGDIPYEDTWDRSGAVNRAYFQEQVAQDLRAHKVPFLTLRGDLEARVREVAEILRGFTKYMNVMELTAARPQGGVEA